MSLSPPVGSWTTRIERVLADLDAPHFATPAALSALERLCERVVAWNAKINLTAASSADELVDLMLADAALVADRHVGASGESWTDVGSGVGAPGLPLALLLPSARLTLVEPREKRVAFLRSTIGDLGSALGHVSVLRARSDTLAARSCDVAISRATLGPDAWLVEGARLARRAVWVLLGSDPPSRCAGWRIDHDERYRWPLTGAGRRAVRYVPEGA